MDDNLPVYLGVAVGVGILLVCMCSRMTRDSWQVDPSLVQAFLAEDNLRHVEHTLQRHDIEELLREVERWECSVCAFLNVVPQPTCSLCHTKHGVKLIEPFQHDVVRSHLGSNSSYVGSALLNYAAPASGLLSHRASSTASIRAGGAPSSSSMRRLASSSGKVSSLKKATASRIVHWTAVLHHALLPEDLNPHQRSARMRRQWCRMIDPQNHQVLWVRQFVDHDDFSVAYVIQLNPPDTAKACFEIDVADTRTAFELHTIVTSSDDSPPPQQPDAPNSAWTPVEFVDANYTVMGTKLSAPVWQALLDVAQVQFTCKYAWFLEQVASLVVPYDVKHLIFHTVRSTVVEEAVERLNRLQDKALCAIIRVHFSGERGQDAGAVLREWYLVAAQALLNPATGLFVVANKDDHTYIPNPNSSHDILYVPVCLSPDYDIVLSHLDHLDAFKAVGRFIGRALLDGQMLPLPLSPVVFKAILGVPFSLEDVESLDRSVYKSLRYILDHDTIESLALTFSVTERRGSSVAEVDLVPRGSQIDVNDANKHAYVDLMLRHLVFQRFDAQLLALVQGVYDILPPELLVPFDHKELELLLCGLADIDVQDWRAHTDWSTNLAGSLLVEWFWDLVGAMTPTERATLLQYTTGSSRVPVQGFRGLTSHDGRICRFSVKGVTYFPGAYPTVHACFNRIDLPLYPRKELLVEALNMMLLSNPTGFDIA